MTCSAANHDAHWKPTPKTTNHNFTNAVHTLMPRTPNHKPTQPSHTKQSHAAPNHPITTHTLAALPSHLLALHPQNKPTF